MQKWLIPREGLIVRDPISKQILEKQGAWKTFVGPEGRYWRRRVNCGDVTISNPPGEKKTKLKQSELN